MTSQPELWCPYYQEGTHAHQDGKSEQNNPYGQGQLMERCAWAGGFHDKRMECVR